MVFIASDKPPAVISFRMVDDDRVIGSAPWRDVTVVLDSARHRSTPRQIRNEIRRFIKINVHLKNFPSESLAMNFSINGKGCGWRAMYFVPCECRSQYSALEETMNNITGPATSSPTCGPSAEFSRERAPINVIAMTHNYVLAFCFFFLSKNYPLSWERVLKSLNLWILISLNITYSVLATDPLRQNYHF